MKYPFKKPPTYSGVAPTFAHPATPAATAPNVAPVPAPTPQGHSGVAQAQSASARARMRVTNRIEPVTGKRSRGAMENPPDPTPEPAAAQPLLLRRQAAIARLKRKENRIEEPVALKSVERSVQASFQYSAGLLVGMSSGEYTTTAFNFDHLLQAGLQDANTCFAGLSQSDVAPFDRAQVVAHCIIMRLQQVDFVDANGQREQRVDAQGQALTDTQGQPVYRKLGEARAQAATPTPKPGTTAQRAPRDTMAAELLEQRQISALAADFAAKHCQFEDSHPRAEQLNSLITSRKSEAWTEKILTLSRKHGPQILAFMFQVHDADTASLPFSTSSPEYKEINKIRNGLAYVLIECTPEQIQELFNTVQDQSAYDTCCCNIKDAACAAAEREYALKTRDPIKSRIRIGISRLKEAPYEPDTPAASEPTAPAEPVSYRLFEWMLARAAK
jgi:hypothetical protein